jgi:hypothetical protein
MRREMKAAPGFSFNRLSSAFHVTDDVRQGIGEKSRLNHSHIYSICGLAMFTVKKELAKHLLSQHYLTHVQWRV